MHRWLIIYWFLQLYVCTYVRTATEMNDVNIDSLQPRFIWERRRGGGLVPTRVWPDGCTVPTKTVTSFFFWIPQWFWTIVLLKGNSLCVVCCHILFKATLLQAVTWLCGSECIGWWNWCIDHSLVILGWQTDDPPTWWQHVSMVGGGWGGGSRIFSK